MGLAGDQQDPQLVAHPLDRRGRLGVERRQRVGRGIDLELENVGAGMIDRRSDVERLADLGVIGRDELTIAFDGQRRRRAPSVAVEDAGANRLVLADDAEARRFDKLDAPVALALMPGDQHMQGA